MTTDVRLCHDLGTVRYAYTLDGKEYVLHLPYRSHRPNKILSWCQAFRAAGAPAEAVTQLRTDFLTVLHRSLLRRVRPAQTPQMGFPLPSPCELTVAQVAARLHVGRATVYKKLHCGSLPYHLHKGTCHVWLTDVLAYQQQHRGT